MEVEHGDTLRNTKNNFKTTADNPGPGYYPDTACFFRTVPLQSRKCEITRYDRSGGDRNMAASHADRRGRVQPVFR